MELSEEEKKAIEWLHKKTFSDNSQGIAPSTADTLLKLIDGLQKWIIVEKFHIQQLEHYIERLKEINKKQDQYIKELEKYDSRKFIKEENKIKSLSFKKEEVDFMNLGIAIYENFDKIFNDNESE